MNYDYNIIIYNIIYVFEILKWWCYSSIPWLQAPQPCQKLPASSPHPAPFFAMQHCQAFARQARHETDPLSNCETGKTDPLSSFLSSRRQAVEKIKHR